MLGYLLCPPVVLGVSAFEQLSSIGAHRAWLLVDPGLASAPKLRLYEEELRKEGGSVDRFVAPPGEPTEASLGAVQRALESSRPDWIVAIGGGSVLDLAKLAWVNYERPDGADLEPVTEGELGLRRKARFVAVPTTCGSGSEVNGLAYLPAANGARGVRSRELLPDWVLLDPELLETLPPSWIASTGADALAHALESLLSEWSHPASAALAREAVGIIVTELPSAVRHPGRPEPRTQLQVAATLAGLAAANSQLGLVHALADAAGPRLGVPHSRAVAALLPVGMEFNFPAARDRIAPLEPALGGPAVQSAAAFAARLRTLGEAAGLPRSLEAAGASREALAAARADILTEALRSPAMLSNPRLPTPEELGRLLDAAMVGGALPP
ncbi:MAG TPA: iron-containing alcohol dehydrogenase family protein [Thermoplasmata archaeon]|nr:iron-containing alcohol dehydrogenase family protein [Thermoplasmata archaeon]